MIRQPAQKKSHQRVAVQSRSFRLTSRSKRSSIFSIRASAPSVAASPTAVPARPLPMDPSARPENALLPPCSVLTHSSSVLTSSSVRSARARLESLLPPLCTTSDLIKQKIRWNKDTYPKSLAIIEPSADPTPPAAPLLMMLPRPFSATFSPSSIIPENKPRRVLLAMASTPSTAAPLATPPITAFLRTLSRVSSPTPTSFSRREARPPRASRSRLKASVSDEISRNEGRNFTLLEPCCRWQRRSCRLRPLPKARVGQRRHHQRGLLFRGT
ncbi:hypothetical protein C8R47DRAFT_792374 [Mycena vitilis]|nr:hypothetical protein C8R47DRAFT_792374 [Mycena vitilis]